MIDFTKLDLTIPSGVSERLLESSLRNTPLEGLGPTFIKMESIYKVNALYLCAHAILESSFGKKQTVQIARNIFNIKYRKSDGNREIVIFKDHRECIETMAKLISTVYFEKAEKKNLDSICVNFAPQNQRRWKQDINSVMNKMIILHDTLKKTKEY